jgi:oxygen-independent coproporphyrinogen-3 oxidase
MAPVPQKHLDAADARYEQYVSLQQRGFICLEDDFLPAVHYPAITMYPPSSADAILDSTYRPPADGRYVVYVHLPFCIKCCTFCHYPNIYGYNSEDQKERYLDALKIEMNLWRQKLGGAKIPTRSILIGGGTPTFLTPKQLERFLKDFTDVFDLSTNRQFNYDVDPVTLLGDVGRERLDILQSYGVDRLTIGVQAMDNEILQRMNRHHDVQQNREAVEICKARGIQLDIEFIFGYPGQTLELWYDELLRAIDLKTDEIQFYRLKVIPYGDRVGTITRKVAHRNEDLVSIQDTVRMKSMAATVPADYGYHEHLLRRVFAREKRFYSRYAYDQCCNLIDTIGIGLTAFSSLNDRFGLNTQTFDEYYDCIDKRQIPINRGLVRNHDQQLRWNAILPLKNHLIRKQDYKRNTGVDFEDVFREKRAVLSEAGLILESPDKVELTGLGKFFADEVAHQFYHPDFSPFPSTSYVDGDLNPHKNNRAL